MIPALTCVFSSATMQHHPILTRTQISDDLVCRCRLYNTPWGIKRTWRNAISDSNRFRQHGQACFGKEIPLCEVRAPNKLLHTKQDTTYVLHFDGDTIQTDGKLLTLRWRRTNYKRRQLEDLKHRASYRMRQLKGVATCLIGYNT